MPYRKKILLIATFGVCLAAGPIVINGGDAYEILWQSIGFGQDSTLAGATSFGAGYQLTGVVDPGQTGDFIGSGYAMVASVGAGNVGRPSGGSVTPAMVEVEIGDHRSGGVGDLHQVDDRILIASSAAGHSRTEPNVTETVFGAFHSGSSATTLTLTIDSSITSPGGVATVRLRNWATGEWAQVGRYPIGTSVESFTIEGIEAADYVHEKDGRIELSIRHVVITTFEVGGFESRYDRIAIRTKATASD